MSEITTDLEVLRKVSEPIKDEEISEVAERLIEIIPKDALGLAAPQICIHKRIFIANLSSGRWIFVNPKFTHRSLETSPFTEGCLSLPDITRRILRHTDVRIECDVLMNVDDPNTANETVIHLYGRDATIVQHELDHLNGVLIIDHSDIPEQSQEYMDTQKKRKDRIITRRNDRKNTSRIRIQKVTKMSTKRAARHKKEIAKIKKSERSRLRQEKIRVEIQERYKAEQKGLFKDENDAS